MSRTQVELPAVVLITGTDTEIGKTLTTAALAATLQGQGATVAVYKPVQTGVRAQEAGDAGEVGRLAGTLTCVEGIRLELPMAPTAAAVRENRTLPTLAGHLRTIRSLADQHDHVLVEGSGGLLVSLDEQGNTMAELAAACHDCAVVVVCRSGLGTLNHTLLTLEALAVRGVTAAGLVVGSWPNEPTMVELDNVDYFLTLPVPVLGRLPAQASLLTKELFSAGAATWLSVLARIAKR